MPPRRGLLHVLLFAVVVLSLVSVVMGAVDDRPNASCVGLLVAGGAALASLLLYLGEGE